MKESVKEVFMNQIRIAKLLKGTTIMAGFILAFFFFVYIPKIGYEMAYLGYDNVEFLYAPCLAVAWGVAVLCYLSLWRFWCVCSEIQKDNSFSMKNANAIIWISRYAFIVAVLLVGALGTLCFTGYMNPGGFILFGFCIFVALGAFIVTYCLAMLVKNAAILKEQTEFTI